MSRQVSICLILLLVPKKKFKSNSLKCNSLNDRFRNFWWILLYYPPFFHFSFQESMIIFYNAEINFFALENCRMVVLVRKVPFYFSCLQTCLSYLIGPFRIDRLKCVLHRLSWRCLSVIVLSWLLMYILFTCN